jgi:hypothetical protein
MNRLFETPDDRKRAVALAAAVAMHGLICADRRNPTPGVGLVKDAFAIAENFIKHAETI